MWKHMALRQLGIYTQQSAIKMVTNFKKRFAKHSYFV